MIYDLCHKYPNPAQTTTVPHNKVLMKQTKGKIGKGKREEEKTKHLY